ncbi:hypothetical protein ACX80E_17075, partial [Arthrobacter sp. TMN-49]
TIEFSNNNHTQPTHPNQQTVRNDQCRGNFSSLPTTFQESKSTKQRTNPPKHHKNTGKTGIK